MPGGRWGRGAGFGGGAGTRRIAHFLEPCLLLLLRIDATHGYNLLEALGRFGFTPGTIDASVVYRVLREMQDAGWVNSRWDTSGSGAPRRVYSVTTDGEAYLEAWIHELRCTRDEIDQFIETYTRQEALARRARPAERSAEDKDVSG
jgi:PadR family transcriptional regulator, regulatory protein PadR